MSSQHGNDVVSRLTDEHKKLVLIQEVGRALSSGLGLDALLSLIMSNVTDLMDADRSTLYLLSEDNDELWSKLVQGPQDSDQRATGAGPDVGRGLSRPLFGGEATEFTPPRVARAEPDVGRGLSRPLFGGEATEFTPPRVARAEPDVGRGLSRPLFGGEATEFTPPRVARAEPDVGRGLSRPLFGGEATEFTPPRVARAEPDVGRGLSRPLFGGEATEFTPPRVARAEPSIAATSSVINIRLKIGEGIAGWVAQTGKIVNIEDVYQDARFDATVDKKSGYRTISMLCVPMQDAAGQRVGVLQVLNKKSGPFLVADEELLMALASQAAVAIANARLVHSVLEQNQALSKVRRDLERKTRELNAVYEIEKEVSASFHMDELLRRILAQTIAALGGGGGSIALRQPDSSLQFTTVQGPLASRLIGRVLAAGVGILGWSVQHRTPVIVEHPSSDPRYAADLAHSLGIVPQVLIIAPLIDGDDVVGGIEIIEQRRSGRDLESSLTRRWNEDDLKMLVLIAAQIARAIGLARQRNQLQTNDRLASIGQMMAGVLHDLKTPMTIISGYAQLMAGSDDAQQREHYVDLITRQFDLMSGMTREILAFSRGDADVVIRKVYMHRFIDDVQTQMQTLVAGRNVTFEVRDSFDGIAWFDDQKLLRVIHNLVRNAVEAMPAGGGVTLQIVESENALCWTIADNGPGIPHSMRSRLFELFATDKNGGTGLGLAIVKKIIDDHDGLISCDSNEKGTAFHFQLPKRAVTD